MVICLYASAAGTCPLHPDIVQMEYNKTVAVWLRHEQPKSDTPDLEQKVPEHLLVA